jgi:hypothetical protein
MIFALRKTGDGDRSDNSGMENMQGEAASVSGIVGVVEGIFLFESDIALRKVEANLVRAAVETGDNVGFALHPTGVIGRGTGECGVEERLDRLAEAPNIDDESMFAGYGKIAEQCAETPGVLAVEVWKAKLCLLVDDTSEICGRGHG